MIFMTRARTRNRTRFTSGSQAAGTSWPAAARKGRRVLATRFDKRCKCPWWITQCQALLSLSSSICLYAVAYPFFALVLICDKSSLTCVQLGNSVWCAEDPSALESVAELAQQHIRHCTTTTRRTRKLFWGVCRDMSHVIWAISEWEARLAAHDRRTCMTYAWLLFGPLPTLLPTALSTLLHRPTQWHS